MCRVYKHPRRDRKTNLVDHNSEITDPESSSPPEKTAMGSSRDSDQSPPHHHQPLLSSLVVRPSLAENSPGGAHSNDYEPGELRRDPPPPPYSRSDRYSDDPGL